MIDVREACGALESYCRRVEREPPRAVVEPMCIADWACDDGYRCNVDTFECDYVLE